MKISLYPPLSIYEIGQRDNQEDAIVQWDNRLFVLCDGMGGHERGEVASQTVCSSLVKWFEVNIKDDSFSDDQLREALENAYTELDAYDDDSPRKMGTTLTLLYIHNKGVTAAHIGDSRIYHIRPTDFGNPRTNPFPLKESLLYRSRDHSLVFDLLQAGEITYEEMESFPQKNIVTRAMTPGEENRMRPDIIHISDIRPNDWFVLCSDGLLENMDDYVFVQRVIADHPETIISQTVNNQDNHSAWLIHVEDVIFEKGDEELVNEEATARCNTINIIPQLVSEPDDDVVIVKEAPKKQSFFLRIKNLIRFNNNKK